MAVELMESLVPGEWLVQLVIKVSVVLWEKQGQKGNGDLLDQGA